MGRVGGVLITMVAFILLTVLIWDEFIMTEDFMIVATPIWGALMRMGKYKIIKGTI